MDKKLAIMQPYFMPYIGYWQLINAVDIFVVYDDVNYIKGGYINRNSILGQNSKPQYINLLLSGASSNKLIKDVLLNTQSNWKNKLLKQLKQNYSKAPYFSVIYPLFEGLIDYKNVNLSMFLSNSLHRICGYLNIKTRIIESSTIFNNKNLDRADRLIDICKKEKANHYINAIGGKDLYHKPFFAQHDIRLSFLKANQREYKQFSNPFVDGLSIIDVMMFNSVEEIAQMLNNYELV